MAGGGSVNGRVPFNVPIQNLPSLPGGTTLSKATRVWRDAATSLEYPCRCLVIIIIMEDTVTKVPVNVVVTGKLHIK